MVNLFDTLNTYWASFVGSHPGCAILLEVLIIATCCTLGYLLIRGLASLFMSGKKRWALPDIIFLSILICYIVKSFFPDIFTPTRYIEIMPENSEIEVIDIEE